MLRSSRSFLVFALASAAFAHSPALAQSNKLSFIAELDASQIVVAPSNSTALGTACFLMDPDANTLEIKIVFDGLLGNESATHIHGFVPAGVGGPPQYTMGLGQYKSEVWNYPESAEADIINELAYIKVHSDILPTGEIRGQIRRVQDHAVFVADMDASQIVVAPSASPARGLACMSMNTQTNTLNYQMTITASTMLGNETSTHIHGYVPAGVGGPPQHTMPLGFHKKASWTYPEGDEANILAELAYAKSHSDVLPTGEIRGQMLLQSTNSPSDNICLVADMDAAQIVVAPSNSLGRGTACAVMNTKFNTLRTRVVFDNLLGNETATHIHGFVPPGVGGPPQYSFALGNSKDEVWVYPEAFEDSILADLAYVKAHSDILPTGEIRGQLNRVYADATLMASMDASQIVVAPSNSPALGLFCASLDTTANVMTYQMTFTDSTLLGNETASHIHGYVLPGVGGPPQHTMALGFHKNGTWNYPEVDEANILAGLSYAKVHSDILPTGEIRGQNLLESTCSRTVESYCTAGVSASGCTATISASGFPSATADSGFNLLSAGSEGNREAIFFFGSNGRQAIAWGNSSSYQCVVPPVRRTPVQARNGTAGGCDAAYSIDLNARWTAVPRHNPGAGAVVQAELWYRDPNNTSNRTSSMSDAVEFTVCP